MFIVWTDHFDSLHTPPMPVPFSEQIYQSELLFSHQHVDRENTCGPAFGQKLTRLVLIVHSCCMRMEKKHCTLEWISLVSRIFFSRYWKLHSTIEKRRTYALGRWSKKVCILLQCMGLSMRACVYVQLECYLWRKIVYLC